jgi:UrcA family protein
MNKSMTLAVRAMTISAVVALGFGAANASAAGVSNDQSVSDGVKQYVVRFPDLDLSKMAGATALYVRLQHAARVVCDPLESRELGIAARYRACMDQAVTNAVAGVNRPLLSEYHQLHTKGDKAGLVQLARAN